MKCVLGIVCVALGENTDEEQNKGCENTMKERVVSKYMISSSTEPTTLIHKHVNQKFFVF